MHLCKFHAKCWHSTLLKGLMDDPVFSALGNLGASPVQKWGTKKPPGGPGPCLMQKNGALYNASCNQKRHFGCKEKPASEYYLHSNLY